MSMVKKLTSTLLPRMGRKTVFKEELRTLELVVEFKTDTRPNCLVEKTTELVKLLNNDKCIRLIEGYELHNYIINMIETFPTDEGAQKVGYDCLAKLIKKSDRLRARIIQCDLYRHIRIPFTNVLHSTEVLAPALEVLTHLATEECRIQSMVEDGVVTCIFDAVRTHQADLNIQIAAHSALVNFLKNEDAYQFVVTSQYCQSLLSAVKLHSQSAELLKQAFLVLKIICCIGICDVMLHNKVHLLIVRCMQQSEFQDDVGLQIACCDLLAALAYDDNVQHLIELNGSSKTILMSMHVIHNADFRSSALNVIDKLGNAVFIKRSNPQVKEHCDWLKEVVSVMGSHQSHAGVQEAACRVLSKVIMHRPHQISRIGEEQYQLCVHTYLLSCLLSHYHNYHVFVSVCRVIYDVVSSEGAETIVQYLAENEVFDPIFKALHIHKDSAKSQETGFRVIRGMMSSSQSFRDKLVFNGVMSYISAALTFHPDDVGVAEETVRVISCLINIKIVRQICVADNIHSLIEDVMCRHQSSTIMQETARGILHRIIFS